MVKLWVCLLVVCGAVCCSGVWLETFDKTGVWKVPEDTMHSIPISLRFNASELLHVNPFRVEDASLEVTVLPDEDWKLDWVNQSVQFTGNEVRDGANKSLNFSGYYWGRTSLSFYLTRDDLHQLDNLTLLRDDLEIIVDRKAYTLDTVFIIFGSVFILVNNINMGAQLDIGVIKSVLRRPLGPLCGFISQFAVMPLITFGMGEVFFPNPLYRLGLFTLGCSPGGVMSNFWTLMFNGDINLSITMTAISTTAAMGMMPLWMFTLGRRLLDANDNLQVPFANLAISLTSLTIPVVIGILIRNKKPSWADFGSRIIKPFTLVILLTFMTLGIYNSYKVFTMMTWQMAVAGLTTSTTGYLVGALLAKLMCLGRPQIVAISIETAFQNAGVAFMLLKLSLPSPDSDLAALPAMAALMMTGPPVMLIYGIHLLLHHFFGCCPELQNPQHKQVPQEDPSGEKDPCEEEDMGPGRPLEDPQQKSLTNGVPGSPIILNGLTKKKSLEGGSDIYV